MSRHYTACLVLVMALLLLSGLALGLAIGLTHGPVRPEGSWVQVLDRYPLQEPAPIAA